MVVYLEGIFGVALVHLMTLSCLIVRILTGDKGWIAQIPNLRVYFPGGIFHFHNPRNWPWNLAPNVKQRSLRVNFNHHLGERRRTLVAHLTCHLLPLENFSWLLTHAD